MKISQLPAASALAGTEMLEVVQGGTNKRTTAAAIAALAEGGGGAGADAVTFVSDVPENADDFSMFDGGVAPGTGTYLALEPTRAWFFKSSWTKWRFATLQLPTA